MHCVCCWFLTALQLAAAAAKVDCWPIWDASAMLASVSIAFLFLLHKCNTLAGVRDQKYNAMALLALCHIATMHACKYAIPTV